jgi:hypothetical protein
MSLISMPVTCAFVARHILYGDEWRRENEIALPAFRRECV